MNNVAELIVNAVLISVGLFCAWRLAYLAYRLFWSARQEGESRGNAR